jgi:hypothetical protein
MPSKAFKLSGALLGLLPQLEKKNAIAAAQVL